MPVTPSVLSACLMVTHTGGSKPAKSPLLHTPSIPRELVTLASPPVKQEKKDADHTVQAPSS